jgi:hypothetical protein
VNIFVGDIFEEEIEDDPGGLSPIVYHVDVDFIYPSSVRVGTTIFDAFHCDFASSTTNLKANCSQVLI